jgi:NAD-dependent deacetylase
LLSRKSVILTLSAAKGKDLRLFFVAMQEGRINSRPGTAVMPTIPIHKNDRVFVLTGAGISAESGLPTFRASDGLWAGHRVEDVCTPEALETNPALVWQFYSERRAQGAKAQPNPAHIALAELEAQLGDRFFLCTQNVDDLHERAGSRRMVHMHGELAKSRCEGECGRPPIEDRAVYRNLEEVGRCACGARLRPHIVFFGEMPLEMNRIEREIAQATLMVVIGSSGSVYPAANFVNWARQAGARTVYIGPERPLNSVAFTNIVEGKAGEVLPGRFDIEKS